MKDLLLADRLRYWLTPAGFHVVEVDGWQDRGRTYASYAPQGSLQHHTAGALAGGDAPSLGICINGRSDLPGPLCQVFGSRSLVAYVVAAGVANHAGRGGWNGLAGNQTVGGMEMEHDGGPDEPRTERTMDFCARVQCALIHAPGSPVDAANVCQHFEWSTEGKIDFYQWPGDELRARVAALLASGPGPVPIPEDDMPPAPATAGGMTFQRGTDGQLWVRDDPKVNGGAWSPLGGVLTSGPDADDRPDGSVVVVARGAQTPGTLEFHTFRITRSPVKADGSGGEWGGWEDLSGNS